LHPLLREYADERLSERERQWGKEHFADMQTGVEETEGV
jgi:hypothetical protein